MGFEARSEVGRGQGGSWGTGRVAHLEGQDDADDMALQIDLQEKRVRGQGDRVSISCGRPHILPRVGGRRCEEGALGAVSRPGSPMYCDLGLGNATRKNVA